MEWAQGCTRAVALLRDPALLQAQPPRHTLPWSSTTAAGVLHHQMGTGKAIWLQPQTCPGRVDGK